MDASVLVPLVVAESSSNAVISVLNECDYAPIVSDWAVAEIGAAISRFARTRRATPDQAKEALAAFDAWKIGQAEGLAVEPDDIVHAGRLVRRFEFKLLAPDALHLVLVAKCGASLLTSDKRMIWAAEALGLPTWPLPA